MSDFAKKLYSPLLFDCLSALTGALAVTGIILDVGRAYPAIPPAPEPVIKGGALVIAIVVAGLVAVFTTRFDQKHADDFVFRTLTKSAFTAMFTSFIALALWQVLFTPKFGGVPPYATMCVLIVSWSFSYLYTRVRGTSS